MNGIWTVKVCGTQRNGGSVLNLHVEVRRGRKDPVGSRLVGESVAVIIELVWIEYSIECCIPNGLADFDGTCLVNKQHLEKLPSRGVLFAKRWRPFDKRSRRARTASVGDLAELVGSCSKKHSDVL
jgi:hypothetical protein